MLGRNDTAETVEALREHTRWIAQLQAGLAQFVNGNRLTASRPLQVRPGTVWNGSGRLVGWSLATDDAGPVRVILRDGREPGQGDVLAVLDVDPAAAATTVLGVPGVSFGEALHVETSGRLLGAVYIGGVD
jgi:hypothetical protein